MASVNHEGQDFPVTDAWAAKFVDPWPDLAAMTRAQLDDERQQLLRLSNRRPLTAAERNELWVLDQHYNVRNALQVMSLEDPNHPAFAYLGADQLHGNSVAYPCGCKFGIAFDHHVAMARGTAASLINLQAQGPEDTSYFAQRVFSLCVSQHEETLAHHCELAGLDPSDPVAVAQGDLHHSTHCVHEVCELHAVVPQSDLEALRTVVVADVATLPSDAPEPEG